MQESPIKFIKTVLLIDDNDDDEFFFRRLLRKAGIHCAVTRLRDGQEAIDYFQRLGDFAEIPLAKEADVVFLDINMPRASGFEVLTWLKTHHLDPAPFVVVMLSSSNLARDQTTAKSFGVEDYCTKPPTLELLRQVAQRHSLTWQMEEAKVSGVTALG